MVSFSVIFMDPEVVEILLPLCAHSILGVGVPVITVSNLTESPILQTVGVSCLTMIGGSFFWGFLEGSLEVTFKISVLVASPSLYK